MPGYDTMTVTCREHRISYPAAWHRCPSCGGPGAGGVHPTQPEPREVGLA